MFADDAKIFRIIRCEDDHAALQKDLDALHTWSVNWQLKFTCKLFHLGPHHHYGPYFLNGIEIDKTILHKDLGILFDDNLYNNTSAVTGKGIIAC